ncbi:Storage protein [Zea mays]|uniref:Storage protein n=1 Tax=Zea mays TaxID=4577 RepID=A0A1D6HWV6_MAIZE|nr:Storage protein [Zea mays]
MLDAAIRALEVEARDAKMRLDATAQLPRRTQRMLGFRHGGLLDLPPLRLARCAASPSCWICRLSVSSSSSAGGMPNNLYILTLLLATTTYLSGMKILVSNILMQRRTLSLLGSMGLRSQPGLEPDKGLTWQMTKRRGDQEVHKVTEERPGWCSDPHLPPCAAFVEIMATVFSRDAWRCVWHMIQNDLVHGWGLDFALRKCVEENMEWNSNFGGRTSVKT